MKPSAPHILYVITDLDVGGVPLHLRRLATQMVTRGYACTVVSLSPPGPVAADLLSAGITTLSCEARGGKDVRVFRRLTDIINACRPDLIHAMLFHANVAARLSGSSAGIAPDRILCEIQTVEVERRWHLLVDRLTYDGCRLIVGNSPSVIEHLATRANVPRDHLRLIRGGIDTSRVSSAAALDRAALGVPAASALLLWVGRLDPVKGLDVLVRAFAGVDRARNPQLLLVGDGPMRESLQREITQLGLTGRVHLLGVRLDVPALLRTVDGFVFPSRTEGLPNALLEAMSASLPIVTTDVPGCRDLVENGKTGLVVPYGDTLALRQAINVLLRDPDAATALGQRAHERVDQHWRLDTMIDAYQSLYREVLS